MKQRAFEDRPLVYVAGPYTQTDKVENTRKAVMEAEFLNHHGVVTAYSPHMSIIWDLLVEHDYSYWLNYDHAILVRCDALYRMRGYSPGADEEVKIAEKHNIPVFYSPSDLHAWARDLNEIPA
jgi:Domain of unknown function (DUF4406)